MLPPTKKRKVTHTEESPVSAGVSSQYVKRRHSGTIIDYVAGSSDEDDEDYDPVIDEDADPDDCKGPKLTLVNDYDVTIASSSKQKSNTLLSYFKTAQSSSNNNVTVVNNSIISSSAGKNNNSNNNLPKSHHSDVVSVSSSSDDDVEDDHVLNDDNLPELSMRARERSVKIVHFKNPISGSRTTTGKRKSDCSKLTSSDAIKLWGRKLDFETNNIARKVIKNIDGSDGFASNTLWCGYCQHEVALKKTTIEKHISSVKHQRKKNAINEQQQQLATLTDNYLRRQNTASLAQEGVSGSSVIPDILAFRHLVLKVFMLCGLPLHHFQGMEPLKVLLQTAAGGGDLSYDGMKTLIPEVRETERKLVREEIKGKPVAFIFDGTTDIDEVFCVNLRFINDDGWITHRCIALRLYCRSFSADQLSFILYGILSKDYTVDSKGKPVLPSYQIDEKNLCFAIMDGASVNQRAIKNLNPIVPGLKRLICLSHCSNVYGNEFTNDLAFKILTKFIQHWSRLIKNSQACRRIFHEKTKHAVQHLSYVRWFTFSDVCNQVFDNFEHVKELVSDVRIMDREQCRISLQKLMEGNDNDSESGSTPTPVPDKFNGEGLLLISLAVIRDVCNPIRNACYLLEGDGFLSPFAYDIYDSMATCIYNVENQIFLRTKGNPDANREEVYHDYLPETFKVLMTIFPKNNRDKAKNYLMHSVEPAIRNLAQKIKYTSTEKLNDQLNCFKACRFCNIAFIYVHSIEALNVALNSYACFELFPKLTSIEHKDGMQRELQQYKDSVTQYIHTRFSAIDDLTMPNLNRLLMADNELWKFWRAHSIALPFWYRSAAHFALIATSSASVERVFSLYEGKFSDKQQSALQDYKEGAVMIHANYNFRKNEM